MVPKKTAKHPQVTPEASGQEFDDVLRRMLVMPPKPNAKSGDKKAGPAEADPAEKPSVKKR